MTRGSKWLQQIDPDHSIAEAAAVSLKQRLGSVSKYLDRAATQPVSVDENIHQLRVWCRRSIAAIGLYAAHLPPSDVTWFSKWLRRVHKAAGQARDLDVLAIRHRSTLRKRSGRTLQLKLRKCRARAQRPILRIHAEIGRSGKLDRRIDRLINGIANVDETRFRVWALKAIEPEVERLRKQRPRPKSSLKDLHRFRICGKRFRYKTELLAAALPKRIRRKLDPAVAQIQLRLGDLNDHATAVTTLKKLDIRFPSKPLRTLIQQEKRALVRAESDFRDWWTKRRRRDFFRVLDELQQLEANKKRTHAVS